MHSLSALLLLSSTLLTSTLALPAPSKALKARSLLQLRRVKLARRDTGYVNADPTDLSGNAAVDSEYPAVQWIAPVSLGGNEFELLIDTGSSDLWVRGPNAPNPNSRPVYYPSTMLDGQTFNAGYNNDPKSYASGPVALDSVSIGGITIPSMDIGVADTLGEVQDGQPYDGILGLQWWMANSIRPDTSYTFFELALEHLDQPVIAMKLKGDGSGTMGMGYVDDAAYAGDLMSAPADNSEANAYHWMVDGVTFGTGDASFSQPMMFDTGSVHTIVDTSIASAYWAQVNGATDTSTAQDGSGWQYPCGSTLPDFTMYLNGYEVTLTGDKFAWGPVPGTDNMCSGGLVGGSGKTLGTMGAPFWISYYVVFDQGSTMVSWAPQA